MFGLFKKILKKDGGNNALATPTAPAEPAYSRTATPGQPNRPPTNPFSDAALGTVPPPEAGNTTVRQRSGAAVEKIPTKVTLPLDEIVPGLTHEFQSLFQANVGAEVSFPLQVILPQLSTGRIRVSFGDLRNACPDGTCSAGPEHDAQLVDLPLAKVLSRVNSTYLPRKTQRPAMNIPEDVTGLFGHNGESMPDLGNEQQEAAAEVAPAPVAAEAPVQEEPAPIQPIAAPPQPVRKQAVNEADLGNIPSPFNFQAPAAEEAPTPEPAPIQMKAPEPPKMAPAPEPEPVVEEQAPIQFKPVAPPKPPVAKPPVAKAATPAPPKPVAAKPPVAKPAPAPAPAPKAAPAKPPVVPKAATAPASAPAGFDKKSDDNFICVPVASAKDEWPESVQQEIAQHNLGGADVALPYGEVDLAMRKGKIVFDWKTIRSWIVPAGAAPESSEHDTEQIVLPLKLVAPLFLKQRPTSAKKRQVSAEEEEIPDLFSGGPAEEEVAPQAAAPAPTPAPAPPAAPAPKPAPAPAPPAKAASAPAPAPAAEPAGELSGANPAQLVSNAAQLPGVSGSLLAMNDGLLVAAELPQPLVGETVAAFLPQIFGRLTQFSSELKLGDLTSVMLVMDNSPWIIFRTGKIYFAVVGRSGEALPLPQLTAIVAEIKRQN